MRKSALSTALRALFSPARTAFRQVGLTKIVNHAAGRRGQTYPAPPNIALVRRASTCLRLLSFAYLPSLKVRIVGDRLVIAKMVTSSG
jgi:hypothetical protein